jgi:hypothetical protein
VSETEAPQPSSMSNSAHSHDILCFEVMASNVDARCFCGGTGFVFERKRERKNVGEVVREGCWLSRRV